MHIANNSYNPSEIEQLDLLAKGLVDRGFQAAAIFFLEMHKPLIRLAEAGLFFCAPLLRFIIGTTHIKVLQSILESHENVEYFIGVIEKHAAIKEVQ